MIGYDLEYIKKIDNLRSLKEPFMDTKDFQNNNKRYFISSIVMPHCFKKFLNYLWETEQSFVKKKDAESHIALLAIIHLHKKGILNDNLYIRKELLE